MLEEQGRIPDRKSLQALYWENQKNCWLTIEF